MSVINFTDEQLEQFIFDLLSRIPYWTPEQKADYEKLEAEYERRKGDKQDEHKQRR